MSVEWYYVSKGNRLGPISQPEMKKLILSGELKPEDFVWKKGFEKWLKLKDVPELHNTSIKLTTEDKEAKIWFVRIGHDRSAPPAEYGPFNLDQLRKLFDERRINARTLIFTQGMFEWKILADMPDYHEVFDDQLPPLDEKEKRQAQRKPFVARMFIQSNKRLFEGICRDISVGGMQVLVSNFPGKVGDRISINVHPENTEYHFVASGYIVRLLDGKQGFSFRFTSLSDEARRAIENYLASENS